MKQDPLKMVTEIINNLDDAQAGEVMKTLNLKVQVSRPKLPPNIMIFQTAAYLCATKLKPVSNKILMLFFSLSAYENVIGMDIKSIGEDLGMSERSVKDGLKELLDHNVIQKVQQINDKRRNEYFLSPFGAWRGNSVQRNKLLSKMIAHDPDQLSLFGVEAEDHLIRESNEIRKKSFPVQNAKDIRKAKALELLNSMPVEED